MFTEVHHLLSLYLTVPMTSATAERTFSTLRRLKSYLRSTMTQKEQTDELDLTDIAKKIVSCNERRLSFFGSF